MIKCGLYARVSTDIQAEVKNGSLDTQIDRLQKYVELKDTTPEEEWQAVAIYREEGKSGKNLDRPEFKRMVQDIEHGKINAVLCTKIDRVSRSSIDFYHFHEFLEQYEATFISLQENWDTSTAIGRFALKISLATAELERERTSERTKEKMQWRAEKGLRNGGQHLLGYDIDPDNKGVLKPNESERELVLLIFQTYEKEKSFRAVARIINEKGYRTKSYVSRRDTVHVGKKFNKTQIMRMLQNEFYIGKITHKSEVYEGLHEPIIPLELWNKVQAIIKHNRDAGSRSRKQNLHTFLLQGLVKCGLCQSHMTPSYALNHQKKPYFYYHCTCKIHRGNEECKMKSVPAQALERVIIDRLIQLSDDQKRVQELIAEATTSQSERMKTLRQAQKNYRRNLKDIEKRLDVLVESIAGRKVGIKTISQKIIDLEEQKSQIEQEMMENEVTLAEEKQKAISVAQMKQKLMSFEELFDEATPEEQKDLLRLHINYLIYTPDGISLALFGSSNEANRTKVQRDDTFGSGRGTRTPDPWIMIPLLYQLSYAAT